MSLHLIALLVLTLQLFDTFGLTVCSAASRALFGLIFTVQRTGTLYFYVVRFHLDSARTLSDYDVFIMLDRALILGETPATRAARASRVLSNSKRLLLLVVTSSLIDNTDRFGLGVVHHHW